VALVAGALMPVWANGGKGIGSETLGLLAQCAMEIAEHGGAWDVANAVSGFRRIQIRHRDRTGGYAKGELVFLVVPYESREP
jgi:hypothetical protein